jgi:hypothetical protein
MIGMFRVGVCRQLHVAAADLVIMNVAYSQLSSNPTCCLNCTTQKDASGEAPEQTAERIAGLLRMVKYQPNMDP